MNSLIYFNMSQDRETKRGESQAMDRTSYTENLFDAAQYGDQKALQELMRDGFQFSDVADYVMAKRRSGGTA